MPDAGILHRLVQAVTREVRLRRAEFFALRGLFAGAVAAAVPLLLRESLGAAALAGAGGLLVAGGAAGWLWGFGRRVAPADAARLADRGFGLEERVATALEWGDRPDRPALAEALVGDAVARVSREPRRRIIPRVYPREARFIPVPLALGLLLALAPPIPLPRAALPDFTASRTEEEEKRPERVGPLASEERRPQTRPDLVRRGDVQERVLTPRHGGGAQSQPGDLAAVFKDTSLAAQSPDFNMFLKKGDERIRMLDQVDRLPDLQSDFTRSQYRVMFQKAKELRGGLRPDQVSPEKLRELLQEMERLGRKGGSGGAWGGDIGEGFEALEQGQTDRAMEAMERALSKLRSLEERGRGGKGLRGGREGDRRGQGRERGQGGGPGEEGDFPEGEGLYPGRGKSGSPKGDPTQRLRANPFDVGVEGEARQGRKQGYDTNMVGRGANMPSRLQYLGVMGQYRRMMEEAIAREQIPRDFQTQVKQYFQALDER
jgi:hypothetical protein